MEIVDSGIRFYLTARQAGEAFCKVLSEDCGPDGKALVEYGGWEFRLEPGVWHLAVAHDNPNYRGGHSGFCSLQPSSKWDEVLRARDARRAYWRARQKALERGCSVAVANESARRHCEKQGLTKSEVYPVSRDVYFARQRSLHKEWLADRAIHFARFEQKLALQSEEFRGAVEAALNQIDQGQMAGEGRRAFMVEMFIPGTHPNLTEKTQGRASLVLEEELVPISLSSVVYGEVIAEEEGVAFTPGSAAIITVPRHRWGATWRLGVCFPE